MNAETLGTVINRLTDRPFILLLPVFNDDIQDIDTIEVIGGSGNGAPPDHVVRSILLLTLAGPEMGLTVEEAAELLRIAKIEHERRQRAAIHDAHPANDGCMFCCERCNTDTHRCPACGDVVGHRGGPCTACLAEVL